MAAAAPALHIEPLSDRHDRQSFTGGVAPPDRYLRQQAEGETRRHVAACFVLVGNDDRVPIGYYTLAMRGDRACRIAQATRQAPASLSYSHSSIFGYLNALIFQRNFFPSRVAIRTANQQKFLVLIFYKKSRDSDSTRFQQLSTTIGQFFASSITQRVARPVRKIPSQLVAQCVHSCAVKVRERFGV